MLVAFFSSLSALKMSQVLYEVNEWIKLYFNFSFYLSVSLDNYRIKREDIDDEDLEKQLCLDKGAGEWFRLETGDDKCRDVIQCTASVRSSFIFILNLRGYIIVIRYYSLHSQIKIDDNKT